MTNSAYSHLEKVTGVGCNVTSCKYHTNGNHCSATKISVQNENAMKKAETFCSTFCPKGSC